MKVNISRQIGILSLPEEPALLDFLTEDGRYQYLVRYNVDVAKAIRNKAMVVKIHATNNPPNNRDVPGFARMNTSQIVESLLTRQTQHVEINRVAVQNYIASITSDITAHIPNDKAKTLATSTLARTRESVAKPFLYKTVAFKLAKASDLTQQNISQPILQIPLYQPNSNAFGPSSSPQEHSFALLFRFGRDPASVATPTNLYISTEKAHAGILQLPSGVARAATLGAADGPPAASFGLLSSVVGSKKGRPADQTGLANNAYVPVYVSEETNIKTIEEVMLLNISDLGDQFYLIFSLQTLDGIEVERVSSLVQHSKAEAILSIPGAPMLEASEGNGYNRLCITQFDRRAQGVYLYRRTVETHTAMTDAPYVQIAKIPLSKKDVSKWFTDPSPGMKPVIYRAICYNHHDVKSHEFASAVVIPKRKYLGVKTSAHQKQLFCSVKPTIVGKTIQVEINNIPPFVLGMEVFRRDLSRHQNFNELTRVAEPQIVFGRANMQGPWYVTDTSPVNGRIYEYMVRFSYLKQPESWSTATATIQFNPVLNNIISTTSSPIKAVNTGTELDIQFILNSVIQDGQIDQIRKSLEQQGLLGFFQDDITQNREKLQNLIAYHIIRSDLTTGEHSDMGVFVGTEFSDRAVGKNMNVPAPQEGHVYTYTINTHFRSAQSLIPSFTKTVSYPLNPSQDYEYKPSKWHHPVTLTEGSIVTDSSLKRNHANTDFTFGLVGDILELRIDLSDIMPSIHDATAKTFGKRNILVEWSLKGSNKKIDHFIVTREELGMKTVVGKSHALSDSNLQFLDRFYDDSKDSVFTYYITPVFFDYTHGTTIQTQQVIRKKG